MFFVTVKSPEAGAAAALVHRLDPNVIPWGILADRIAEAALADHHVAIESGDDKDGFSLIPITEATVARRKRRGDGTGPPLAPNDPGGRASDATATIEIVPDGAEVLIRWPVAPWVRYHADGQGRYGPIAVRDIVGIRPETWGKFGRIVHEFVEDLLAGRI